MFLVCRWITVMDMLRGLFLVLLFRGTLGTANIYSDALEQLTTSNTKFALNLYKEIIIEPKVTNVVFSPVSVSAALAMVKLGSKENSTKQIEEALLLGDIESALVNSAFGELNGLLFDKPQSNITLKGANGAFISKTSTVLKDYKNALSGFGAKIEELDFSDSKGSVDYINKWISEETGDLIPNMLSDDSLNSMVSLLLTSTLYFSGQWHSGFNPVQTEDRAFYVSRYRVINTPFMYQRGKFRFGYIESLTLQIVEIPYAGQDISMFVLLPDNFDLDSVEKNLNYDNLTKWLSNLEYDTVDLTIPKFKVESEHELQAPLRRLGVEDIFSSTKADLSGISGDKSLFVDAIFHKGVLEVTEEGSKAAAATTIRLMARSIDLSIRFFADHPFVWFIRHNKTKQILFLGRFTKPDGKEMSHQEL